MVKASMKRTDAKNFRRDGQLDFSGGVNGAVPPPMIDPDQVVDAVNSTFRAGVAQPRPGYTKHDLTFATGIENDFQKGLFQRAWFFDGNGTPMLVAAISGRLFRIDCATYQVTDITPLVPGTTTTTANFTIPTVPGVVTVTVVSTTGMNANNNVINIGGFALQLTQVVDQTHIQVQNNISANAGTTVTQPATVKFSQYDINNPLKDLAWAEQAENYLIVQDNRSLPMIFNGGGTRRSNRANQEVPVGNVMCYQMGRLSVALPDRQSFRTGDIVFGSSGTPANGYRDAMLRFTENSYLNEGGDFVERVFGAPSIGGPILAMKAFAMTDAQLGQGPMMVGQPYCVFTCVLPFDRTTWKNLASPLQTVNPLNGPLGQDSTVLVNADIWYRSVDGYRSYMLAQRQFQTWGNTSQSAELDDLPAKDTQSLLEYGSAVVFDNRLIQTISPVKTPQGVYHRGFVVMDFNLVSTTRKKLPPAWEGVWTNVRCFKVLRGIVNRTERCFMFTLSLDGNIELWEIDPSSRTDNGTPISWSMDMRSMNCGDEDNYKMLETGRIILDNIVGQVNGTIKYQTDSAPCWQPWATFTVCAKFEDCGPGPCSGPITYREQQRTPVRLPMPSDGIDQETGHRYRTGYEFQPRIEMTGWCQIRQFRIYALDAPEMAGIEVQVQS